MTDTPREPPGDDNDFTPEQIAELRQEFDEWLAARQIPEAVRRMIAPWQYNRETGDARRLLYVWRDAVQRQDDMATEFTLDRRQNVDAARCCTARAEIYRDCANELEAVRSPEAVPSAPADFPVISDRAGEQYPKWIQWSLAEKAYGVYSERFPGSAAVQSLERIAQRGGFYTSELDEYVPGWHAIARQGPSAPAGLPECEACDQGMRLAPDGVHYDDARGGWTWGVCRKEVARLRAVPSAPAGLTHELKTWPDYYSALADGRKTFEYRRDDRGFKVGDVLHLREWEPTFEKYTGREMFRRVSYILPVSTTFVVMALSSAQDTP